MAGSGRKKSLRKKAAFDEIDSRIDAFKKALASSDEDDIWLDFFVFGQPYVLDAGAYALLKTRISQRVPFVYPTNVVMVGSGKLGFSLNPGHLFRRFSEDDSDIDIAIVSATLFDGIWLEIAAHAVTNFMDEGDLGQNFFRGRILPGSLPNEGSLPLCLALHNLKEELDGEERFTIYPKNTIVYRTWKFLEIYQKSILAPLKTRKR